MKPETSLNVVTYPTTWLAGYEYDNLYINITVVTTGNTTLLPDEDDTADMNVRIFDQNDNDVTDTIGSFTAAEIKADIDDTYKIELPNEYITTAGTYRVYAYNKTHNSEGHNATLVVKQAKVECDKSPFIWKYDDNISATFTVTDEVTGDLLAGTLLIDNMTWTDAKYNRTWTNTSFDGSADQGGNNSVELGESEGFTDGKVTVNDITADFLPTGVAEANITFWFRPELADGSDGVYARAKGIVKVTVPAVAVDKQYVSVGKTTTVVATVTGRGETIDDVFVRLHGRGIDQNGTSGADGSGKVSFSILPTSTGNISIDVGEAGRTVTTKILVTAWALEISTDPQVDEGGTITVTALKEGTTTPVENADITFNQVTKTTDSNGQVTFTAPAVTSDRTYTIEATAAGYLPDSTTITVINVPKLTIVPPSGEIYGTETFTVTVADDEGQGKVGAKVTFNGDDYYTGAGGAVTITAPDVKETSKQYTLTATLAGFTDATPITITINKTKGGVPGFELLTLIAAIGVAFILLRRRRN